MQAARIGALWFIGALGLLADSGGGADAAEARSLPKLASIAGIQVGHTTREELEARWGAGKAITGGHPQGARLWRVKGTSWVIWADAFNYSERGIVVDFLSISKLDPNGNDAPFAHVSPAALAYFQRISLGMTEEKVLAVLKEKQLPMKKTQHGWEISASGFEPLTSIKGFDTWTVQFEFKNKLLSRLVLGSG